LNLLIIHSPTDEHNDAMYLTCTSSTSPTWKTYT